MCPSHQPESVALSGGQVHGRFSVQMYFPAHVIFRNSNSCMDRGKGSGNPLPTSAGRFPVQWEQRGRIWLTAADPGLWFYSPGLGVGQGTDCAGNLSSECESFPKCWVSTDPHTPCQHPPLGT